MSECKEIDGENYLSKEKADAAYQTGPKEIDGTIYLRGQFQNISVTPEDGDQFVTTEIGKNDVINTGSGNDIIRAGYGHDQICSGDGHDEIHAGTGVDYVNTGAGNDTIHSSSNTSWPSNSGVDVIIAGPGNDIVHAFVGPKDQKEISLGTGKDELHIDRHIDVETGNVAVKDFNPSEGDKMTIPYARPNHKKMPSAQELADIAGLLKDQPGVPMIKLTMVDGSELGDLKAELYTNDQGQPRVMISGK